jgi:Cu2+-exporting ATPase
MHQEARTRGLEVPGPLIDGGDLVLARAGEVRARFAFADVAREDARTEVAALGARGLDVFILSGDHGDKVAALAR